jgi:putative hemolysin
LTYGELALVLIVGLFFSGMFSGSETGLYSVKSSRLDLDMRRGARGAGLVRRLTQRRATILITILIGNNLALELMTLSAEHSFETYGISGWRREVFLTLVLTPIVFLFGELLPKDLYRRRPHDLMRLSAPLLTLFRVLFWPLERVLSLLIWVIEKLLGFGPEKIVHRRGRAEILGLLAEGRAAGVLEPQAEELARNALRLRSVPITQAMIAWADVECIDHGLPVGAQRECVQASAFTRLPVMEGGAVVGYVHQLGVLQAGQEVPVLAQLRPLLFLDPELSVDRALSQLRLSGRRLACVGSEAAPLGLVTLKDLVEEISGDLGGW